ncbi:MAG: hypothetical protein BWY28_03269 [bacterium ADurb.Bin236]|nr:MAG: hypothetical protein BWY28_03269 [bacterium ADurb.Bin236]
MSRATTRRPDTTTATLPLEYMSGRSATIPPRQLSIITELSAAEIVRTCQIELLRTSETAPATGSR